jgi:RNA polymerase sigma factor for flagellar operon FliA
MQISSTASHKKLKKSAAILVSGISEVKKSSESSDKASEKSRVDQLVVQYLPYATSIATKVVKTLSNDVDFDDILCNARLGLLEAAQRYDAKYGVDFRTFAYYRIKGAIYDGLRKTGWLPRSLYSKIKFEQAANDYLESKYGPNANSFERELCEISDTVNSIASVYVMSIEGTEDLELEDKDAKKNIEHRAEFQKIKDQVCDAIESLPDKERKLIKMYYFQNKTLEEIGEQLDLSKSWTSRLHARSLELLFKKVSQFGEGDSIS